MSWRRSTCLVCRDNFKLCVWAILKVCACVRTVGGTHPSHSLSIMEGRHTPEKNFFYKNHKTSTRTTAIQRITVMPKRKLLAIHLGVHNHALGLGFLKTIKYEWCVSMMKDRDEQKRCARMDRRPDHPNTMKNEHKFSCDDRVFFHFVFWPAWRWWLCVCVCVSRPYAYLLYAIKHK